MSSSHTVVSLLRSFFCGRQGRASQRGAQQHDRQHAHGLDAAGQGTRAGLAPHLRLQPLLVLLLGREAVGGFLLLGGLALFLGRVEGGPRFISLGLRLPSNTIAAGAGPCT